MEKNREEKASEYYYIENGFIVFTEAYHLKRGYCCKSAAGIVHTDSGTTSKKATTKSRYDDFIVSRNVSNRVSAA